MPSFEAEDMAAPYDSISVEQNGKRDNVFKVYMKRKNSQKADWVSPNVENTKTRGHILCFF